MIVTEENKTYYLQAMKVDFLTKQWERDWYATTLMQAAAWGRKIDRENKEYLRKMVHLTDKYNT